MKKGRIILKQTTKIMNIQEFKNLTGGMKALCATLCLILIIFLVALIISTAVDVQNKIKEGEYIGQDIEAKNTITVSATGEVFVKPDLAVASFSVVNEAKAVSEALSENTKKMNKVIDFIKSQGVEDKDLKTAGFNIYPRYEWLKETIFPLPTEGKRVLVGYEVQQSLEVKIRDLTKIGQIIEGATAAGANQVGDLQFTLDKKEEIQAQARKEAIEKAKAKARELANQLGVNLVRITNFTETSTLPPPFIGFKEIEAFGGAEVPQIEPGQNKIEITVSITYEIR